MLCAEVPTVILERERGDITPTVCVICVGNQAALTSVIKGSASSDTPGVFVSLFWNIAAHGYSRWRVGYDIAKSNIADCLSRQRDQPGRRNCQSEAGKPHRGFWVNSPPREISAIRLRVSF